MLSGSSLPGPNRRHRVRQSAVAVVRGSSQEEVGAPHAGLRLVGIEVRHEVRPLGEAREALEEADYAKRRERLALRPAGKQHLDAVAALDLEVVCRLRLHQQRPGIGLERRHGAGRGAIDEEGVR